MGKAARLTCSSSTPGPRRRRPACRALRAPTARAWRPRASPKRHLSAARFGPRLLVGRVGLERLAVLRARAPSRRPASSSANPSALCAAAAVVLELGGAARVRAAPWATCLRLQVRQARAPRATRRPASGLDLLLQLGEAGGRCTGSAAARQRRARSLLRGSGSRAPPALNTSSCSARGRQALNALSARSLSGATCCFATRLELLHLARRTARRGAASLHHVGEVLVGEPDAPQRRHRPLRRAQRRGLGVDALQLLERGHLLAPPGRRGAPCTAVEHLAQVPERLGGVLALAVGALDHRGERVAISASGFARRRWRRRPRRASARGLRVGLVEPERLLGGASRASA